MAEPTLHQQLRELVGACDDASTLFLIVEATVELHKPRQVGPRVECDGCDLGTHPMDSPDWPCSTIRVVAEQLGVNVDG